MMNSLKKILFSLLLTSIGWNTYTFAELNSSTEAVLNNNDPLLADVLTHVVNDNILSSELQLQCEAILTSNAPYKVQLTKLLKGQSCNEFIAQNITPIKQDFGEYIQTLSSVSN